MNAGYPLNIQREGRCIRLELCDPRRGNLLNRTLIEALHAALDDVENFPELSLLILSAEGPVFCDGMDFNEALATVGPAEEEIRQAVHRFHALLERLARVPVIVAALVDGRVNAGGMGLVAASDLVLAGPAADFGLSEILFGLLPVTVTPFLVRRTGLQAIYRMALTAQRMNAERALACGLVDELISDPTDAIRRLRLRADRLEREAVHRTKAFYADYAGLDGAAGQRAEETLARLFSDSRTVARMRAFAQGEPSPWLKPST